VVSFCRLVRNRAASAACFRGGEAGGGCYAFERDEHRSPARRV